MGRHSEQSDPSYPPVDPSYPPVDPYPPVEQDQPNPSARPRSGGRAESHPHLHGHSHGQGTGSDAIPLSTGRRLALVAALIPIAVLTLVGLVLLWPHGERPAAPPQYEPFANGTAVVVTGTIVTVTEQSCAGGQEASVSVCATAQVRLDEQDGDTSEVQVDVAGPTGTAPSVGDSVRLIRLTLEDETIQYTFDDYDRSTPLLLLAGVFAVAVLAVARWKGLSALVGLGITYAVLVVFQLPALLAGENALLTGLVACSVILFVVLYVAHGVSAMTTTALLGTMLGLGMSALLSVLAVSAAHLTGLSSEATAAVQANAEQISVSGLLLCGFLIGSLGVLNDVTVTQASAVFALRDHDPDASALRLYRAGMRVGRDHIASTVYTLVLAYAGSALPALLLFSMSRQPLGVVLTGDEVGVEIARALVGAVGLITSVPLTTGLAALVAAKPRRVRARPR